jgi:hypothetical protein
LSADEEAGAGAADAGAEVAAGTGLLEPESVLGLESVLESLLESLFELLPLLLSLEDLGLALP